MTLVRGDILQNRYRITSLLAQGGMAAVYRGWHTTLNIPIAIKEMHPQPGLDAQTLAQLRQQFRQEAAILARLEHPNLVDVLDFFEEGDNSYLIMDMVAGESLADCVEREGALPERVVWKWAKQLLHALEYCHSQSIIHRDIKPSNIIIRPDNEVILVDFGLVKLWDPNDPNTKVAMQGMGTPEYAAPEQYGIGQGYTDQRSDIYSLGATLYHALTGEAPMTATDRTADVRAFKSVQELNPAIGDRIDGIILHALELRIADRFDSATEMKAAFNEAKPPYRRRQYQPAGQPAKWIRLAAGILLGALAFLVLVIGLAIAIAQP